MAAMFLCLPLWAALMVTLVHGHTHSHLPKMLDLTWTFDNRTQYFMSQRPEHVFRLQSLHKGPHGRYNVWTSFNHMSPFGEHGGTHMDAPSHYLNRPDALAIHQIPLESLMGPGVVIDISARADRDPRASVTKNDLLRWEDKHGRIPEGAVVLLYSGWEKRFYNDRAFWGSTSPDFETHVHPGFSLEAAQFLLKRNIHGIGTDTGNFDIGGDTKVPVHVLLLGANIWGLEMVKNLGQVPANGTTIIALPMNIRDGTGAPARVIARWPENSPGSGSNSILIVTSHFPIVSTFLLVLFLFRV